MNVLFSDPTVLVVSKPSGQLVHNSAWAGPREDTLIMALRAEFGSDLRPVHRLDRGTSGVILVARGSDNAQRWQTALSEEGTQKAYLAALRGPFRQMVGVDHPVKDSKGQPQAARTAFFPLADNPALRASLALAYPLTGRIHQIRRHAKHISHPVLGDASYGKGKLNRWLAAETGLGRLALHAAALFIRHPQTHEEMVFRAPLPPEFAESLKSLFPKEDIDALVDDIRGRMDLMGLFTDQKPR